MRFMREKPRRFMHSSKEIGPSLPSLSCVSTRHSRSARRKRCWSCSLTSHGASGAVQASRSQPSNAPAANAAARPLEWEPGGDDMSPAYTASALGVAGIFALVLLNAFFVATEFSLVAVRRTQVRLWESE